MNIPNELSDIVVAVVGGYAASVITILGGGWALINRFVDIVNSRQDALDNGLKERQESFMSMMSQHIHNEEREFLARAQAQEEAKKKLERFEQDCVTKADLERALAPLEEKIDKIERIVESRKRSRDAPTLSER